MKPEAVVAKICEPLALPDKSSEPLAEVEKLSAVLTAPRSDTEPDAVTG